MLAEYVGVLQIVACVLIIAATGIWFLVLRENSKMMNNARIDSLANEKRIIRLEHEVGLLFKLAKINHKVEQVKDNIEKLYRGDK